MIISVWNLKIIIYIIIIIIIGLIITALKMGIYPLSDK